MILKNNKHGRDSPVTVSFIKNVGIIINYFIIERSIR